MRSPQLISDKESAVRMRLIIALLVWMACSTAAWASSTLRVGSEVLVTGDSRARVTELLGKPASKSRQRGSHSRGRRGGVRVITRDSGGSEQWHYLRDGQAITVTLVDGKVSSIDERRR